MLLSLRKRMLSSAVNMLPRTESKYFSLGYLRKLGANIQQLMDEKILPHMFLGNELKNLNDPIDINDRPTERERFLHVVTLQLAVNKDYATSRGVSIPEKSVPLQMIHFLEEKHIDYWQKPQQKCEGTDPIYFTPVTLYIANVEAFAVAVERAVAKLAETKLKASSKRQTL